MGCFRMRRGIHGKRRIPEMHCNIFTVNMAGICQNVIVCCTLGKMIRRIKRIMCFTAP